MAEALKEQQRLDLVRSFDYAKKKLNVGINWRVLTGKTSGDSSTI